MSSSGIAHFDKHNAQLLGAIAAAVAARTARRGSGVAAVGGFELALPETGRGVELTTLRGAKGETGR